MASIFFVRHAQPDEQCKDDRTKPLTLLGKQDSKEVTNILSNFEIDVFYSSPYKRSFDTIVDCASKLNKSITTDERFRERRRGINSSDYLEKRWDDFNFCEEDGESILSVQQRNVEAVKEVLDKHPNSSIVIGTHGTALSTIINYFDNSFGCDGFKRIWFSMPYIIKLDFDGYELKESTELLKIDRGY